MFFSRENGVWMNQKIDDVVDRGQNPSHSTNPMTLQNSSLILQNSPATKSITLFGLK